VHRKTQERERREGERERERDEGRERDSRKRDSRKRESEVMSMRAITSALQAVSVVPRQHHARHTRTHI
jgi:hypothetical protein